MLKHVCRILSFLMLTALILPLISCSGSADVSTPTAVFTPQPAIDSSEFSIAYLVSKESADNKEVKNQYSNSMAYLQKILKDRGWNVKFQLEGAASNAQSGELAAVQAVKIDVAAGTAADGYIVTSSRAKELLDAQLAMDLGKQLPNVAPALYGQCKLIFSNSIAGIPLSLIRYPMGRQLVFYIQKDIANDVGMKFSTVEDLLSLLENHGNQKICAKSGAFAFGCLNTLFNVWAGEQGYYSLGDYNIDGGFCAAYSDSSCSPVPIESIPGFDDVFTRCLGFYNDNRIIDISDLGQVISDEVVGYVGPLTDEMVPSFLNNHMKNGSDYIACALTGGAVPVLPSDEPSTYLEMAICAASTRPEQVMRFVQWALIDRDGYDLMSYGVNDVDYHMEGQRVEYLKQGKALQPEDWNITSPTAYFQHGFRFIYNDAMERVKVYAPSNYEETVTAVRVASLPIFNINILRGSFIERRKIFSDIASQYEQTIKTRNDMLLGTLPEPSGNGELLHCSSVDCLIGLHGIGEETIELAAAYAQRIKNLMEEQLKGS